MTDPASSAATWLLGRLRSDTEDGLWSGLKQLLRGDPMTLELEKITDKAIRSAVITSPGGDRLDVEAVEDIVRVLDRLWPDTSVELDPGEALLGRIVDLAGVAMASMVAAVEGLPPEYGATSSLAALENAYNVRLDPHSFGTELAFHWQLAARTAALTSPLLAVLAAELNAELNQVDSSHRHGETMSALSTLATASAVQRGFEGLGSRLANIQRMLPPGLGNDQDPKLHEELAEIRRMVQDGLLFREAGIQLQIIAYRQSRAQ